MKTITIFILAIFLISCTSTNPYTRFYYNNLGENTVSDIPDFILPCEEPKLYTSNNIERDLNKLIMNNYHLVGYSFFNADNANNDLAISHAKTVGAALVLIKNKYPDTVSGSIPLELPATQMSTSSRSGSAGGYSYSYSSNNRTITTKTYNKAFNKSKFDYIALYFVENGPLKLGIQMIDIPLDVRKTLKRNRGAFVQYVKNDSPAFYANIVPGDIIVKVNDIEINNRKQLAEVIRDCKGIGTKFKIIRDNVVITKNIRLNNWLKYFSSR
jgi:serine protease Do